MLRLRIAGGDYGRTRALADHVVTLPGVEISYERMAGRDSIFRMATEEAFDVAEFSISQLLIEMSRDSDRFIALPVFPARSFRHRDIYLASGSSITDPAQLRGARIAVQRYHVSAAVWTRGILAEHYGLSLADVTWCKADIRKPGQPATRIQLELPSGIEIERIQDASIDELLRAGRVDAAILPEAPPCYSDPYSAVERLFKDTAQAEQDYFDRSSVFPILHVIVMRRSVHEANPGLSEALYHAYEQARVLWRNHLAEIGMQEAWRPFTVGQFPRGTAEEIDRFWSYGVEPNRLALETVLGYAFDQGLLRRRVELAELFATGVRADGAAQIAAQAGGAAEPESSPHAATRPFDD